ncbi:hypothetical protein T03_12850 [Trichinella britovi]|uniref:Uncharacterized protein n=1 Tax=Trichinella britovi TaxID=45882 RepID=A0A0V1D725_TRIBR|nr:hypothetical protein T03_12850 [Trichinella britovi]
MIAQAWDSTSGSIIEIFKNSKLSWDRVEQLLAVDNNSLFGTLTDDEILEAVEEDENEDVDVFDMFDKPNEGLSHSEDYSCRFEVDGATGKIQLLLLRHICDVAAQKKLSTCRQKLITDYVKYDTN